MVQRHDTGEVQRYMNWLYDQIRGPLGGMSATDAEAAERGRLEVCVVLEILRDEVALMRKEARAGNRGALYGPDASGRLLDCLGIDAEHRAYKRLDAVERRAEQHKRSGTEVRVILGSADDA